MQLDCVSEIMAVLKLSQLVSFVCALSYVQPTSAAPFLTSILGPLKDVVDTIGSGAGLIQGTLGGVQGLLGVEQRQVL